MQQQQQTSFICTIYLIRSIKHYFSTILRGIASSYLRGTTPNTIFILWSITLIRPNTWNGITALPPPYPIVIRYRNQCTTRLAILAGPGLGKTRFKEENTSADKLRV